MLVTYRSLHKVAFPVYLIYTDNWDLADGLLFLDNMCVDDTNQAGKTIGIRRMQTSYPTLYPLKKAITTPVGILKQNTRFFIDTNGVPFIYEKTKVLTLKYLKIKKVVHKKSASLITVWGYRVPFTVPRPPSLEYKWAGILHLRDIPWMLYEYSETKLKDVKRKV